MVGLRLAFLTATPLTLTGGSGTFAGISALAAGLRGLGAEVEIAAPTVPLPTFTLRRLWFNEQLRRRRWDRYDLTVGVDMDGYRLAGRGGRPHVACIKGVIADEMRFERGATRLAMSVQAACERSHAHRAGLVVTTSRYAAARLRELYGLARDPAIVPELLDLAGWRGLFARNPAPCRPPRFTVLTVCRFYPRKRLPVLLRAAAMLRERIPAIRFRIVGGGPERPRLLALWREMRLEGTVRFLGDLSQDGLAREYNACDLFCLPSVQEGFGIVFLEAMAAGKPIVAARAAAVPEVVEHGLLVEPENPEALAEAIARLHAQPALCSRLSAAGAAYVARFDAPVVSRQFLACVTGLLASGPGGQ
jgi:glycosyltransferase involved in cell wall biosynthesis